MQFVFAGVLFSFSEYFLLLVDKFNVSYTYVGSVGTVLWFRQSNLLIFLSAIIILLQAIGGFSNFVGPLSGRLVLRYSYQVVIPLAGILLGLAFFLTSFDTEAWQLFFTYSVLWISSYLCQLDFICLFTYFEMHLRVRSCSALVAESCLIYP